MKAVKVLVKGIVQGVSFRFFVRKNAERLNLKGYVKNIPDGRVEAVFEGKDDNIKEIINLCKEGPLAADVRDMSVSDLETKGYDNFEIVY